MKVAIAGKGGSGKTSISGTLARILARRGRRVLAIDADSNPNLALTLGIPLDRLEGLPTLTRDLVAMTPNGVGLTTTLDELCSTHALTGPDGVTLLVMAHPQHAGVGCHCGGHAAVRSIIEAASTSGKDVCILDTEASPEHLSRGTAQYADAMLVVVEPYFKSLETARRMAALGNDLGLERVAIIGNKVRDERELDAVQQFAQRHGLELAGVVPFDSSFQDAERAAEAPLDFAPDAPAMAAIATLAHEWGGNGRA